MHYPVELAKGCTADDLRELELGTFPSEKWEKVISCFNDRIEKRYISPIDDLIAAEDGLRDIEKKCGFIVLTIDFLLMETLQAFMNGSCDSAGKSRKLITQFLEERESFRDYFSDGSVRKRVYEEVRCGLLHQAEIQGTIRVHAKSGNGALYENGGDGLEVLYRDDIHRALKDEFRLYIDRLRKLNEADLRENFKQKFFAIVDYT